MQGPPSPDGQEDMDLFYKVYESSGPGLVSSEEQQRAQETFGFWPPCPAALFLRSVRKPASPSLVGFLVLHAGLAGIAFPFSPLPERQQRPAGPRRASHVRQAWVAMWVPPMSHETLSQ